jgi:hypothetical protein
MARERTSDFASQQLDLFTPAAQPGRAAGDVATSQERQTERRCTGCGRPEQEAPIYVMNELGRFCVDCEAAAFRWPPPERPYAGGGPDHAQPGSNPAVDGQGRPPRRQT